MLCYIGFYDGSAFQSITVFENHFVKSVYQTLAAHMYCEEAFDSSIKVTISRWACLENK